MKKNIRMVGLDLDGTLLNDRKKMSDYTRSVLEEAIAQGCVVLIATGRPICAVSKEVLDVKGMKYALTVNGGKILDLETGEVLYSKPVPFEKAVEVLKICCEYDIIPEILTSGHIYTNAKCMTHLEDYYSNPSMIEYVVNTRTPVEDVTALLHQTKESIDKLRAVFRHPEERLEARRRLEAMPGLVIVNSSNVDLEINVEGTDKGSGLLWLGEQLGISREEIMACGDSNNDYEMLKAVGWSVAMGNSEEAIKEIADYITDTNDNDGVAKAFEKFVLK